MQPERNTDSSKEREPEPQPEPESVIPTESLPKGDLTQDEIPFGLQALPEPLFDPDNSEDWGKMVRYLTWWLTV